MYVYIYIYHILCVHILGMPTQCKLQRDHSCGKLANDTIATGIAKIKENVFIRNRTTPEKQKRQTTVVPFPSASSLTKMTDHGHVNFPNWFQQINIYNCLGITSIRRPHSGLVICGFEGLEKKTNSTEIQCRLRFATDFYSGCIRLFGERQGVHLFHYKPPNKTERFITLKPSSGYMSHLWFYKPLQLW